MKKYLTMWQIWAVIAVVLAIILITNLKGTNKLLGLSPFALLIICPIMMMFMMGGNKHKK